MKGSPSRRERRQKARELARRDGKKRAAISARRDRWTRKKQPARIENPSDRPAVFRLGMHDYPGESE
jgi:hypothetical protein